MPISKAHTFYNDHVTPAIHDWRSDELAIHKAKAAATNLNQLADYYWACFEHDPAKNLGATSLTKFRDQLGNKYPDFALIRDISDGHKHCEVTRITRKITNADQTTVGALGYGEGPYGEGRYGSPKEIVVTDDSGGKHHFTTLVERVDAMWVGMLK